MTTTLILEDDAERMKWFYSTVKWSTLIMHAATIPMFQKTVDSLNAVPELIILDHDLGDDAGGTGFDACALLPDAWADKVSLVVVWSWNTVGAERMHAELAARGFPTVIARFGDRMLPTIFEVALTDD